MTELIESDRGHAEIEIMSVENQMNLCALQRVDPYIERIITSASQVALYK